MVVQYGMMAVMDPGETYGIADIVLLFRMEVASSFLL
jgi:hypothetical protein